MFIGLSVIAWLFVSYQTYKTKARKRVGCADQSRAASTALIVGEPPANPFSAKKRNSAGGNLRKRQRGRLVGRVRLWADRRRGSDYTFVLKWVLANSKNRSKLEEIRKLSPEWAVFSLVARSANQGLFRGEI